MPRPDTPGAGAPARERVRIEVADWSRRRGLIGSVPGRPDRHAQAVAILVVDPDRGQQNLLAETLRSAGYAVVEAVDDGDVRRLVEHMVFTAIVVDMGDSDVALESVLAPAPIRPPVVVLTDRGADDDRQAIPLGAVARLRKPVAPTELVGAIALVVGRAAH